jgi:Tfp pilus assembly protein PilF
MHADPVLSPERLDSWKDIATYLKRSVRTVRRWEAEEGLPVHRHHHQSSGSVYAFNTEIDAWVLSRRVQVAAASASMQEAARGDVHPESNDGFRRGLLLAGAVALTALVTTLGLWRTWSVTDSTVPVIHTLAVLPPANQTGGKVSESKSVDAEASQLFFKSFLAASAQNYEGIRNAITLCQKAIDKQPDFAPAYARLAFYYLQLPWFSQSAPKESMLEAEKAALKAVLLDDTLADAHVVLANVFFRFRWDWSRSEKEFLRALAINPNDAEAHRGFSEFLSAMGRSREAISEALRAQDLDQLSTQAILNLGLAYRAAGDYDSAIGQFRRGLDKDPARPRAHFLLGVTYVQQRMLRDGIEELETASKLTPDNTRVTGHLAYAYAIAGRRTEARDKLETLLKIANRQYVSPLAIARIYAELGKSDAALAWLDKAYQARDVDLVGPATNPDLADLRSNPQYREFLDRVALNH